MVRAITATICTYHLSTKIWNCWLKPLSVGNRGGSASNTCVSTSKSVLHPLYGNDPVANSTSVMPSDQTSARISYSGFLGSIRSGCETHFQWINNASDAFGNWEILTAIYAAQPAERVLAFESTKRPLIPKSHNLIFPRSSISIFDGFTSLWMTPWLSFK